MLIILPRKRSSTYDLLRKVLRMPKLGLGVSLKSYCQSPVSSSMATLKEREQEASRPEVSTQWPEVSTQWPEVSTQWPEVSTQWPEVSTQWPEVSTQLPVDFLNIVVSAVNKLGETDTVVGVVLG